MTARTHDVEAGGRDWNVVRSVSQLMLVWVLLWAPVIEGILRIERVYRVAPLGLGPTALAWVPFALATALGLWAAVSEAWLPMDRPVRLVVSGPYRWVRNPMGVATVVQGLALAVRFNSPLTLAYVVVGWLSSELILRWPREADLDRRFGEAFRTFRRRVRRWRPALTAYDPANEPALPPLAAERTRAPADGRAVALHDPACEPCARAARRLAALGRAGAVVPTVFAGDALDAFPGVSRAACAQAVHLVAADGAVYTGAEAVARALATRPVVGAVSYLYYVPGVRLAADGLRWLVARRVHP